MATYIDIEIIQALPFANANRDDAGLPKTVVYGGETRGRLSSQSLKRAARFYNIDNLPEHSISGNYYRTQYVHTLVKNELLSRGIAENDARLKNVNSVYDKNSPLGTLNSKGKGNALTVITTEEIKAIADLIENSEKVDKEALYKILLSSSKRDLALWGRFFASGPNVTMEGSAQVAHAFTTHSIEIENDFFTGMDDGQDLFGDAAGAGHPGNSFYETGVFYKYANIGIEETVKNLLELKYVGGNNVPQTDLSIEDIREQVTYIVKEFIESFSLSVPQGKIRATAHTTVPSFIRVAIRDNRSINGSSAFYVPVGEKDAINNSVQRLAKEYSDIERIYGTSVESLYIVGNGINQDELSIFGNESKSIFDLSDRIASKSAEIAVNFAEPFAHASEKVDE